MRIPFSRHIQAFLAAALIAALLGVSFPVTPAHAAGIVVNTNLDSFTTDGLCSLREAILNANTDSDQTFGDCAAGSGADNISFAADYTITLNNQLPPVTSQVTINGNGWDKTIIRANALPNTASYRIFQVNSNGDLTLYSMELANGRCTGSCATGGSGSDAYTGSAAFNMGQLTLLGVHVDSNVGDAIFNRGNNLLVAYSLLTNTTGSAIYNYFSPSTIQYSEFHNNAGVYGGAIHNDLSSTMAVNGSTFVGNSASTYGGGIYTDTSITVSNSIFYQNSATYGGGLYGSNAAGITLTVRNSTFSENSASAVGVPGAGIHATGALDMANTVVANSTDGVDCGAGSMPFAANNMVEDNSCPGGVNFMWGDPKLSSLGFLGNRSGIIPLYGSPLIDAGDDTLCAAAPVSNKDAFDNTRPSGVHCDIGALERYPTFTDAQSNHWAYGYIERLYAAGITGGCSNSPLMYCPESYVTRAQMAIFLLRAKHGSSYSPPAATGTMFADVPSSHWAAKWIEQLANEGITTGCGGGNFCPEASVTRDQMAIFLLRGEHGSAYTPPVATGTMFADISSSYWAAKWIEQLANEGITTGCGGGNYCPGSSVTRAQMAVFLVKAFGLP